MNKVIVSLFALSCFVFILGSAAFSFDLIAEAEAKIKSYQAKIVKVEASIKSLEAKLKKAKGKDKASITKSIDEQRKMITDMNKIINKEKAVIAENQPVNTDAEIAKVKAEIAFYQGKITKIKSNSKKMRANPKSAKAIAAQDKRVASINKTISKLQASLAKLESQIAPTNVTVVPSLKYPTEKKTFAKSGFAIEGGLQGGAAAAGVVYFVPAGSNMSTRFNLGYGIGDNYSVMIFGGGLQNWVNPENYIGASIDLASYSSSLGAVQGIPGLGTINSGSKLGFGLFAGKKITNNFDTKIAYSTALGIMVTGIYQF